MIYKYFLIKPFIKHIWGIMNTFKKISKMSLGVALIFGLGYSCLSGKTQQDSNKENNKESYKEFFIGERKFSERRDTLVEIANKNNQTVFGIISDTHSDVESTKCYVSEFKKIGVDAIIHTGDIAYWDDWIKFNGKGEEVLKVLAETKLPVYVLPGNHELKYIYDGTMGKLQKRYSNLINLSKFSRVDAKGVNFVANAYGDSRNYITSGYYATESSYIELEKLVKFQDDDIVILITHQPPRCGEPNGIDASSKGIHIGNQRLDEIMKKNKMNFSLSGHIHGTPKACDNDNNSVDERKLSLSLRLTPGTGLYDKEKNWGSTAVIKLMGKEISYTTIKRNMQQ